MTKIFHPLLALIASASDRELAKYVQFLKEENITKRGLREMYVLVWLCMSSREVIVSTATEHPNSAWVIDQTKRFLDETAGRDHKPDIVMHDGIRNSLRSSRRRWKTLE